jgi:hypothetical protein
MTWLRLDDGFATHPKVLQVSDRSLRAFLVALCWSGHHSTDGKVPASVISRRAAAELLKVGLFEVGDEESFLVHDFLDYNPSKEEIENERRSSRERMRRVRQNKQENNGANTGLGVTGTTEQDVFARFWEVWPRKVEKRAAERAFRSACKRESAEVILAGAERYRDDPQRRPEFTKHPTTWLNGDCWADESDTASPPAIEPDYYVAEKPSAEELAEFAAAVSETPWSKGTR